MSSLGKMWLSHQPYAWKPTQIIGHIYTPEFSPHLLNLPEAQRKQVMAASSQSEPLQGNCGMYHCGVTELRAVGCEAFAVLATSDHDWWAKSHSVAWLGLPIAAMLTLCLSLPSSPAQGMVCLPPGPSWCLCPKSKLSLCHELICVAHGFWEGVGIVWEWASPHHSSQTALPLLGHNPATLAFLAFLPAACACSLCTHPPTNPTLHLPSWKMQSSFWNDCSQVLVSCWLACHPSSCFGMGVN